MNAFFFRAGRGEAEDFGGGDGLVSGAEEISSVLSAFSMDNYERIG
jgi:hypothetical protein